MLHTLLESLGCLCTTVPGAGEALDLLRRKTYDAIVLDLYCSNNAAGQIISGIMEMQPTLIEEVLVIDGEATDSKTMQVLQSHRCPMISRDHILHDLWDNLQRVFRARQPPSQAA